MNKEQQLQHIALNVREHIVRMSTDGGCFTGASLSAVDIIVYLYTSFLNISPNNLDHPDRDYLFLSKGHDVPALYGTLAELGILEKERLQNHLSVNDHIYWHPNTRVPGIEFHSGSLGHLPSVAVGVAMDIKISGGSNKVVCILGDGELNEGTCWEALLVANAYHLDNLIFVIDRNHFQANVRTEELIPLEPLADKFEAFGAAVKRINGHSYTALEEAFATYPFQEGKVNVVIADTMRGKGLPSIQERADRWFCNFSADEVEQLLLELHGQHPTELTSETLIVR
ncbi:transketolase [Mucilaginibacter sp. Bleaf8]|uniref:transketolase n=1 Tax=Mucilaginibacter sp. Bleaf8 TaxID=2834430 RepID=UPI001BCF75BF|nr:1-deoxy-D-xylulose-5-phosphate synthase N-terminal domain-containing protein [Mucilaginibacter sp. Bleaf8]MBS7564929.1 transketolase [Mucilaginibacter sp. Bleaf8]